MKASTIITPIPYCVMLGDYFLNISKADFMSSGIGAVISRIFFVKGCKRLLFGNEVLAL